MSKKTADKIEKILKEIEDLFSDTSVSQHETLEALGDIRSDIDFKIHAIDADLKRDSK